MGTFLKKKELTIPIFGPSGSGKTYALCALIYWATQTKKAVITKNEHYTVPRLTAWQMQQLTEKTQQGVFHEIELTFKPRAISDLIDWPIRLTTYDVSGDDYTGGALSTLLNDSALANTDKDNPASVSQIAYKKPSPFFTKNIAKADGAIAVFDLLGIQKKILDSKPKAFIDEKNIKLFCQTDGSPTVYNEHDGVFKCTKSGCNRLWTLSELDEMLYTPPAFCPRHGEQMQLDEANKVYHCPRCATPYNASIPPGRLNWTNTTLKLISAQGEYFNSAINVLSSKANLENLVFEIAFTKADSFPHVPDANLKELFDAYATVAVSKMPHYNVSKVSSMVHNIAGFEGLLRDILLTKCK